LHFFESPDVQLRRKRNSEKKSHRDGGVLSGSGRGNVREPGTILKYGILYLEIGGCIGEKEEHVGGEGIWKKSMKGKRKNAEEEGIRDKNELRWPGSPHN